MTVQHLREQLLLERQKIDEALLILDSYSTTRRRQPERRRAQRRKPLHWTQRPENKAKLKKTVARMTAARLKKAGAS